MVSEKTIFFYYKFMRADVAPPTPTPTGRGQFRPKDLDWQDLCGGPLNIAAYFIYNLWVSWFQRKGFSHYKSKGANDLRGVAKLNPMGLICRISVEKHLTMLHTLYISCGPQDFREEDFFGFCSL